MRKKRPFKTCTRCSAVWPARKDFLEDPDLALVGYQVNFHKLKLGLFLFNHKCKTTISVPASVFTDMYHGKIFKVRKTGTDVCPGYCLLKDSLAECPAVCECAYVRKVLRKIVACPKKRKPSRRTL